MKIVITEFGYISRLFEAGFLNRFTPKDIQFFITGDCVESQNHYAQFDHVSIHKMMNQGMLKIVDLDEKQNMEAYRKFNNSPNYLFETLASLVYANYHNITFYTEDPTLRDFAYLAFEKIGIYSKGPLIHYLYGKLEIHDRIFNREDLMSLR